MAERQNIYGLKIKYIKQFVFIIPCCDVFLRLDFMNFKPQSHSLKRIITLVNEFNNH